MNIFKLDVCPIQSAQDQCDKHVVKMVIESAQMLSTAHRMVDGKMERRPSKSGSMLQYWELPDVRETVLYKGVHFNHPSTVWTRESKTNYDWHYKHFAALCDEYTYRYGKVHATDLKLRTILSKAPSNIPNVGSTPFKLAMKANPECMFEDAVKSYRAYYHTKQERFSMVWTKRSIPDWWQGQRLA
mgnify:FL=1|jgi:hypothetical protein|tara:strand:+ start:49 stop:606 length:558 start_codon:yes stop_codon:yes gene_type:complete